MRQSLSARCAVIAALVGVALLFVGVGSRRALGDDAAQKKAAPKKSEQEVSDSGWAVSPADGAPAKDRKADGPTLVKPGGKPAGDPKAKSKEKEPRVASRQSSPRPLKWVRASEADAEGDAKPAPDKKAKQPAEEAEQGESPSPKPADKKPASEAPKAESSKSAAAPQQKADSGKESEPSEPAPFPDVIELDEESAGAGQDKEKPAPKVARKRATRSVDLMLKPEPKPTPEELKPLSRYQRSLRQRLRSVLSFYYRRPLNSVDHDPWELMHNMLAYGQYSRVLEGGRRGKPMTAVGYLCYNLPAQGKQMMSLTNDGVIETRVAVGMQGHKGQLLAMLAQCDVSPEYPIRVEGAELTIKDLIRSEQLSCYTGEELTFKLIGLMHYLDPAATWVNDQGETWSFPRLIQEERNQKIRGAPCGGTHRLSGLSLAVRKRRALGEPVDGEYREAERFVGQYLSYAYRWQNPDGSLSTEWFRGPGAEEDMNRRVRTTGHLLEWMLYTVPDSQLTDQRIVRSVNYLTGLLASNTSNPWEIGPLSHALHALALYDERVFQPHDGELVAAAKKAGKPSRSPEKLNYRNIDSRVVASMPSADDAEAARAEIARANSGLRGLFGARRRPGYRSR